MKKAQVRTPYQLNYLKLPIKLSKLNYLNLFTKLPRDEEGTGKETPRQTQTQTQTKAQTHTQTQTHTNTAAEAETQRHSHTRTQSTN